MRANDPPQGIDVRLLPGDPQDAQKPLTSVSDRHGKTYSPSSDQRHIQGRIEQAFATSQQDETPTAGRFRGTTSDKNTVAGN